MIGILSSGLGGLLVVRELERRQPRAGFCYWGDTACGPWGSRSAEFVRARLELGLTFLQEKGANNIVVASGDGSVVLKGGAIAQSGGGPSLRSGQAPQSSGDRHGPALSNLAMIREREGILIDYWDAQIRAAEKVSKTKRVGVIGSRLVIGNFEALGLEKKGFAVFKKAIPALAPLIVEGEEERGEMRRMIRAHLQWFKTKDIDCLALGSIHYTRMMDDIQTKMGKRVLVINPVKALVDAIDSSAVLEEGEQKFYLTDMSQYDVAVARQLMGRSVEFGRIY